MPAPKLFAATVTGLTVFGGRAEIGGVSPYPDYATALATLTAAHQSGRMEPLTPGLYPDMAAVVTVFEVPLTPGVLAAVRDHLRR